MDLSYYLTIIPSSLSTVTCSVFLYFFIKYDSVRYTFGMNHVAILQTADLVYSIVYIIPINNHSIYCNSKGFITNSLIIFQSFWVAIVARFNYQVICLKLEKESISIFKPAILGLIISFGISVIPFVFKCYKSEENQCKLDCEEISIFIALGIVFIFASFCISVHSGAKLLIKLRNDLKYQLNEMKWSFIRLTVYPFITFVCLFPVTVLIINYVAAGTFNETFSVCCYCGILSIGFFNSIALGFTREFRDALRFRRKIKIQALNTG